MIVGCGPSGVDISKAISKFANHVTLSYHSSNNKMLGFLNGIPTKPDIARFTKTGIEFVDGSFEEFSTIIYCTGDLPQILGIQKNRNYL